MTVENAVKVTVRVSPVPPPGSPFWECVETHGAQRSPETVAIQRTREETVRREVTAATAPLGSRRGQATERTSPLSPQWLACLSRRPGVMPFSGVYPPPCTSAHREQGDRHPTVTCSMMDGEVMVACPRPRCSALRPRGTVVFIQAFDVE